MKFLSKLLGAGASEFVDSVTNTVDEFHLSKEEKQDFKLKMQEYILKLDERASETYKTEINARADIIKAELAQGDKYTKRARPTIIYIGLGFICIVHVIIPLLAFLFPGLQYDPNKFVLPQEFWWAWGTVVSVYGAGRTIEKRGITNKFTQLATGSGAAKVGGKINEFSNLNNAVG